jgi:hypothetical protein
LGAVDQARSRSWSSGSVLVANSGPFAITYIPRPWSLYFRVEWMGGVVMTGDIRSDGRGHDVGGRASVMTWKRGTQGLWQAELFDAFATDSDRLLRVPLSNDVGSFVDALNLRREQPKTNFSHANSGGVVVPFRRTRR